MAYVGLGFAEGSTERGKVEGGRRQEAGKSLSLQYVNARVLLLTAQDCPSRYITSEFDALLRSNPGGKGVLDFPHFSYEVSSVNERSRSVPACNNDVQRRLVLPNRRYLVQYFFDREHVVTEHIYKLVKNQHVVIA